MNEDDNLIELETEAAYDISRGGISQLMLAKRAEFPPPDFFYMEFGQFYVQIMKQLGD